jgi:hypothetical protein
MNVLEYIRPELLLTVPVLWVLGKILKEASFLRDKWIPLVLGGAGILLAVCWIGGGGEPFGVTGLFTAVTQGILCAGAAVYGHQLIKQAGKDKDKDGDTHD